VGHPTHSIRLRHPHSYRVLALASQAVAQLHGPQKGSSIEGCGGVGGAGAHRCAQPRPILPNSKQ